MTAYLAHVGVEDIEVVVEDEGGLLRASARGRVRQVDVVEVFPGWYSLLVDGVPHHVGIMPDPADPTGRGGKASRRHALMVDGEMHVVEIVRSGGGRARSPVHATGASGRAEVCAPMPGVVVAVRVAEGHEVAVGHPLLVMEAMKMQMDIRSPVAGTVRRVHVDTGVEIAGGQVLVTID